MLRLWQSECANKALDKYINGHSHFFCQATPGAGKTIMAADVAKSLLDNDEIDLVLCFSPSSAVAEGIKATFSSYLSCTFSGRLGTLGASYTYQSIKYLDDSFWETLKKYRIFVVFDEIHHCSFDEDGKSNSWGEQVVCKVQRLAKYTLALSGTPWRSDRLPIAMAEYSDPEGMLVCDYQYTLNQAVKDNVCRRPKIVLVDNEGLSIKDESSHSFLSIADLLQHTKTSYQSIIHNQAAVIYILKSACIKLCEIRKRTPNAAGLIVAASVSHAKWIQKLLDVELKQTVSIVTYHHQSPMEEIQRFRNDKTQWIVSVGMISEGTDIPRLQVCCHLSAVKTELYFRQVLGRILRVTNSVNQDAWLYTFAESNLVEFAERIEQDIPESCLYIDVEQPVEDIISNTKVKATESSTTTDSGFSSLLIDWEDEVSNSSNSSSEMIYQESERIKLGQYRERVIAAFS
ncbi:DEAD/DEAH box helicase [Photobacterium leiognathi subsp. mandapamensis]